MLDTGDRRGDFKARCLLVPIDRLQNSHITGSGMTFESSINGYQRLALTLWMLCPMDSELSYRWNKSSAMIGVPTIPEGGYFYLTLHWFSVCVCILRHSFAKSGRR